MSKVRPGFAEVARAEGEPAIQAVLGSKKKPWAKAACDKLWLQGPVTKDSFRLTMESVCCFQEVPGVDKPKFWRQR